jgi:hypothetical protein
MSYHFHVDFVSRGKGQSLVAKVAYQARAKLREERTGEYKDYTYKPDQPVQTFVDKKHGPEFENIETLANAIDRAEDQPNAQTGITITGALPKDLTPEGRARVVRDFMREHFWRKGIPAIGQIHPPHEHAAPSPGHANDHDEHADDELHNDNWHVHITAPLRPLGPDGQFGEKYITWDNYGAFLQQKRESWANITARYLENEGQKVEAERWRYGHLKQEIQREKALERGDHEWAEKKAKEAGKHRGPQVDAMERRAIETDLGKASREVEQRNKDRAELRARKRELARLERQDAFDNLRQEVTAAENVLAETRRAEREYAMRDPVKEQIAWEDAVAKAAIEKDRQERQSAQKARAGRTGPSEEKHEAPRPRFGDRLITRAAEAAMRDPRQQYGEHSPAAFRDALEKNRLALACVTPDEAAKSHREGKFAKELGRYAPVYQAGELVIVREKPNDESAGRVHKLDQTKAEDYLRCMAIDTSQLQGIEATKQALDEQAKNRQRAFEAAKMRKARGPERAGLAAHQAWAMRHVRDGDRQRREQPRRPDDDYAQKQKRDSGEIDPERYRTDPDYRRHAQTTQSYKSPEEKKRDRENEVRAIMEQQDRGR